MVRKAKPVSTAYYAASLFLLSMTDVRCNSIRQSNLFLACLRVLGIAHLRIYRDGELRGAVAEVAYKLQGIPRYHSPMHPGAHPSPHTVAPPSGPAVACSLQRRPSGSLPQIPAVVRHQPAEIVSVKDILVAVKWGAPSLDASFRIRARDGTESNQWSEFCSMLDSVTLSSSPDRIFCDLNGEGEFRVKDIRSSIDDTFLPSSDSVTRWVKNVPIKVNILAWRIRLDRLPTRVNLIMRVVNIDSSKCSVCSLVQEDSNHLFFLCDLGKSISKRICRWWNIQWVEVSTYAEWNRVVFDSSPPRKVVIFDDIVATSFIWSVNRLLQVDLCMLGQVWGNIHFDFASTSARGMSGGILCLWNPLVFRKSRILCNEHYLVIDGLWSPDDIHIRWIVVYAPQNLSCKVSLWSSLAILTADWDGVIMIMGKFNEVREAGERYGSIFKEKQADIFNEFISNSDLIDIPLDGYNFTWSDKWGSKMSKLDRLLVSESFYDTFPHTSVIVLVKGTPDHRPILLPENVVDYGPTPFRFFHSWLEMEGFHTLVNNTWKHDGIVEINGLISFKKKLQNLKGVIREWVALKKADLYNLKKHYQEQISFIDVKVDQGCASEDDLHIRNNAFFALGDLNRMDSLDLAQKAKIKWAIEGDENTQFFHGSFKAKRRFLAIRGILKDGDWINDPSLVKSEFLEHFCNHFQQPLNTSTSFDISFANSLSASQSTHLERNCSRDEIKRVVWDCGGDRAPGRDGFSFKFFTTFWDLIEEDVVRFVNEFFLSGYFPKGCNSSFITLIPKVTNAKFVSDFHPISLIGCQYKIIGKILANRISTVIGSCISAEQSTFIKGRNILDGPFILNEVLAWYRNRKRRLMIFKVDFEKAFDSVRWDYLDSVMEKMGFGNKWHTWIHGGLRQGDPLSPFLFILAMEGLHALSCKAKDLGLFKGEWSDTNAHNLVCMLRCFFLISGLKINMHKSNVIGVGVSDMEVGRMAKLIGCGVAASLLSAGGHLTLIKDILGNLLTYYMSIYMMPISVQNKLESTRNKFFIGVDQGEKKITWVKWKKCLASKKFGGLGIGIIFGLNLENAPLLIGLPSLTGLLFLDDVQGVVLNLISLKPYKLFSRTSCFLITKTLGNGHYMLQLGSPLLLCDSWWIRASLRLITMLLDGIGSRPTGCSATRLLVSCTAATRLLVSCTAGHPATRVIGSAVLEILFLP
nr:hypothetical protein [Tanacetum cinerariifolium]